MGFKQIAIILTILLNTSYLHGAIRDGGVIGPDGDVVLYYKTLKTDNYIVVKYCDKHTVLGTPAEARKNCKGKAHYVMITQFKKSIKALINQKFINHLKPLTAEEVLSYNSNGSAINQIEQMVDELNRIDAFIQAEGPENADLVRREELNRALRGDDVLVSAVKKVTAETEKLLNFISNHTIITPVKYSSNKNQFIYTVLKNYSPDTKLPCGLVGSIEDRIKDCAYWEGSFTLVTRTKELLELHLERNKGLFWGGRLPEAMSQSDAEKACDQKFGEKINLPEFKWRLPTKEEYVYAEKREIRQILPNMLSYFWTSTKGVDVKTAVAFSGYIGLTNLYPVINSYSVRCVATPHMLSND